MTLDLVISLSIQWHKNAVHKMNCYLRLCLFSLIILTHLNAHSALAFLVKCEAGWTASPSSGTCVKAYLDRNTFAQAIQFCANNGGRLVKTVDSKMEKLLRGLKNRESANTEFWIGFHQSSSRQPPVWITDNTWMTYNLLNVTVTHHQELNGKTIRPWCGVMAMDEFKWAFADCSKNFPHICEKGKDPCINGWLPSASTSSCIKLVQKKLTWFQARDYCKDYGGDLIKISHENMTDFLKDNLRLPHEDSTFYYWIGFRRLKNSKYHFRGRWLDERKVVTAHPNLDARAPHGNCVVVISSRLDTVKWTAQECHRKMQFICERPLRPLHLQGLNFTVVKHMKPNIAITHRPIQGVCSAWTADPNYRLSLNLELESSDLRQRKTYNYIMEKNGNITVPVTSLTDIVLNYASDKLMHLKKFGIIFKLCTRQNIKLTCHLEDMEAVMHQTKTVLVKAIEDPEPSTPKFKVFWHLPRNGIIFGLRLKMFCSAFVGTNGKLVIKMLSKGKSKSDQSWTIYENESRSHETKARAGSDLRYFREPGSKIIAMLMTSPIQNNSRADAVGCFSSNRAKSSWVNNIQYAYFPYKPFLHVERVIDPSKQKLFLSGTCHSKDLRVSNLKQISLVVENPFFTSVFIASGKDGKYKVFESREPTPWGHSSESGTVFSTEILNGKQYLNFNTWFPTYIKYVTVACRVKNVQVCQKHRSNSQFWHRQHMTEHAKIYIAPLEETSREVFIHVVVLFVLGFEVCLLVILATLLSNNLYEPTERRSGKASSLWRAMQDSV